jgi:cytochrome c oxidase subunit 3
MKPYKSRTSVSAKRPVIERMESIHPLKMINYLVISVSCILFAVITIFFISHLAEDFKENMDYEIPKFFFISTILLVGSTHFTYRIIRAYNSDNIAELRKLISFTLIAGLIYFLSQALAWMEILKLDLVYNASGISQYFFIFSGLHFVYVLVGLVMSAMLFYKYMLIENDPVKTLITTTNPHEKVKLEIFLTYWNFLVFSWGLIFLMLLFIF